jgi:hypothetical protein
MRQKHIGQRHRTICDKSILDSAIEQHSEHFSVKISECVQSKAVDKYQSKELLSDNFLLYQYGQSRKLLLTKNRSNPITLHIWSVSTQTSAIDRPTDREDYLNPPDNQAASYG